MINFKTPSRGGHSNNASRQAIGASEGASAGLTESKPTTKSPTLSSIEGSTTTNTGPAEEETGFGGSGSEANGGNGLPQLESES